MRVRVRALYSLSILSYDFMVQYMYMNDISVDCCYHDETVKLVPFLENRMKYD